MVCNKLLPDVVVPTVNSGVNVTNIYGGYRIIGNSCIFNIRFTTTGIDANTWIFKQIPHHIFALTLDHGQVIEYIKITSVADGSQIDIAIGDYNSVSSGIGTRTTAIPAGTYTISHTYLIR